jgi:hypothetical protein
MTPAVISITYRYKLEHIDSNNIYRYIYDNCLVQFKSSMSMFKEYVESPDSDYNTLRPDIKKNINNSLNALVQRIIDRSDPNIPRLTDARGDAQIKWVAVQSQIMSGNSSSDNLEVNLLFDSEPLTSIGAFSNKLVIAIGDKSKDITEGKVIPVITLDLTPDIWINSYQRIIIPNH